MESKELVNICELLIREINDVAEEFQGGDEQKGFGLITSIAKNIEIIITEAESKNISKNIETNELNSKLNEIVGALQDGDLVLVADLFLYELLPIVEEIKNVLE